MRTIQVETKNLIRQLPKQVQYNLIQDEVLLPKYFVFEISDTVEIYDTLKDEYPDVRRVLTWTQWALFRDCIGEDGASSVSLMRHLTDAGLASTDASKNNIAVHMMAIRKQFVKKNLPFQVETVRGSGRVCGSYKIVKIPST